MYRQRKRDRRYVQPSVPKQRPRRNNATRRSVGPAIVFPSIAGRVVRADPLALSWATCCFPLREVCRKSFSNASDSHLRFKISDDALFGRATRPPLLGSPGPTRPTAANEKRADSRCDRRPSSRDPEKQRGEEKRRLGDRFPVDRRAFPPKPTPWLLCGRVLFPVE